MLSGVIRRINMMKYENDNMFINPSDRLSVRDARNIRTKNVCKCIYECMMVEKIQPFDLYNILVKPEMLEHMHMFILLNEAGTMDLLKLDNHYHYIGNFNIVAHRTRDNDVIVFNWSVMLHGGAKRADLSELRGVVF